MTLRGKIVALVVGLMAALLAGVWALLSSSWSGWSSGAVEHELLDRAAALAALIEVERDGRLELEDDAAALRDPSHPWRIVGEGGVLFAAGQLAWPEPSRDHPERAGGVVRDDRGRSWRVVARAFTAGERGEHGSVPVLVQVAGLAAPYHGLEQRFRRGLLLAVAAALVAGGLGAAALAHLSLSPLRRLASEIDAMGAGSLDRRLGTARLDPELRRVAGAFNALLGRLDEALQQQRHFVSRASHALRTPIATILTQAEVALRRERGAAEYREALADVAVAARESAALVAHLLTLARLDERRGAPREEVPVAELAREVQQRAAPRAAEAGVALEADVPDGLRAWAEPSALRELLEALLDNAIRYTPRGGRAGLRATAADGGCALAVWDTGPGIPADERGRVFDRFYRGGAAQVSGATGSGLGLAIVKAIADAHGGVVTLADRAGGGLEVTVVLPGRPAA